MQYLILIVIFIILITLFLISNYFLQYIVNPKCLSSNLCRKLALKLHQLDPEQEKELLTYSLDISADYTILLYHIKKNSNKYVILSHGHTVNHYNSFKYAKIFADLNYNVLMYDSRGHGENKKTPVSLGFFEADDLAKFINFCYEKFSQDIYLGIHGESMGAITSLMVLKHQPKLKFMIIDCAFKNAIYHLKYFIKDKFNKPSWMVYFGNLVCFFRYSFFLSQLNPLKYVKKNNIPICFIHGLKDDYIIAQNSKDLYNFNRGYKELHLFNDAEHAKCVTSDSEKYISIINNFLQKVGQINEEKNSRNFTEK